MEKTNKHKKKINKPAASNPNINTLAGLDPVNSARTSLSLAINPPILLYLDFIYVLVICCSMLNELNTLYSEFYLIL